MNRRYWRFCRANLPTYTRELCSTCEGYFVQDERFQRHFLSATRLRRFRWLRHGFVSAGGAN